MRLVNAQLHVFGLHGEPVWDSVSQDLEMKLARSDGALRFWKVGWLLIRRMVERKLCFRRMNLVTVLGSDWSGGDGSWEVIEQAFVLVQI